MNDKFCLSFYLDNVLRFCNPSYEKFLILEKRVFSRNFLKLNPESWGDVTLFIFTSEIKNEDIFLEILWGFIAAKLGLVRQRREKSCEIIP